MTLRIDQWLPAAHRGDAIGDESLRIRSVLRGAGFESEVYALEIDEDAEGDVLPFAKRPDLTSDDIVILHFALPSPMSEAFRQTAAKKILIYHNITPHEFFVGYDDELVRISLEGRRELSRLSDVTDLALGDSEYNRIELHQRGFAETEVLPILLDFDHYLKTDVNPVIVEMFDDDRANFLFVGRIFPNKKFEDLLKFAFFYKKYVSENFRLILVGKAGRLESYRLALQELADRWGLRPAEVLFTGHIAWDDLLAIYECSDLFLSMSEHEGFAVPLIESMLKRVPVMAYAGGAVPDTLGGAGMLFTEKNYEELAEMAHVIATNEQVSDRLLVSQDRRLADFSPERVGAKLLGFVEEVAS